MSNKIKEKVQLIQQLRILQEEAWLKQLQSFIPWEPSAKPFPKQVEYFADESYYILLRMPNRAAKTFSWCRNLAWIVTSTHPYQPRHNAAFQAKIKGWDCVDIFDAYLKMPSLTIWVLSPDYSFNNDVIWKQYLSRFIPSWFYQDENGKDMITYTQHGNIDTITFKNGTEISFRSYAQRLLSMMGRAVDYVFIDEMPPHLQIISELFMRTQDKGGTLHMAFTPLVVNEEIKNLLENHPNVVQHRWTIMDNPLYGQNPDKLRRYLQDLQHLPENERRARLEGEWYYELEDFVFEGLEPKVVDDFEVPLDWRRVRSLDPSTHTNGYVELAEDPRTGTWYIIKALQLSWKEKASVSVILESLQALKPHPMYPYVFSIYDNAESWFGADPKVKEDGWVPCILKNRELNISMTREALHKQKVVIFKNGGAAFFEQLKNYRKREDGSIIKRNDHVLDAGMYAIRQLPDPLPLPENYEAKSFETQLLHKVFQEDLREKPRTARMNNRYASSRFDRRGLR